MQITKNILMIEPINFRYNEQTAVNNYYQKVLDNLTPEMVQKKALKEFKDLVIKLEDVGVNVIVVKDTEFPDTPDSIFPNNWVSFHASGKICLFPMCAENRRVERRKDIFDTLKHKYFFLVNDIIDLSYFEKENKFLEGTGSMILDRANKICYAAISVRTERISLFEFCKQFDYKPICFTANQDVKDKRMPIYHTNVMMCVADRFVVICLDSIDNNKERKLVVESILNSGKEIIEISEEQKNRFAGNMLQVLGDNQIYLIMSESAYNCLEIKQINKIEKHCKIIYSALDTIEACGGGSARCMMAEVFLPKN